MFEPFCGLSGHPFAPEPDPGFYFPSRAHQHAYRRLEHALHGGGLTVLTGNAGSGKSTTLNAFLRHLGADAIVVTTIAQALAAAAAADGRRRLLVLDDAHLLTGDDWRALHCVNLPTCLVGAPELRQRVRISCHLGPLEREETGRYIAHRLSRVGWRGDAPFEDGALALIHACTGGIPRHINRLCARAFTSILMPRQGPLGAGALRRLIQAA